MQLHISKIIRSLILKQAAAFEFKNDVNIERILCPLIPQKLKEFNCRVDTFSDLYWNAFYQGSRSIRLLT